MSTEELWGLVNTSIDILAKITSHRAELISIVTKSGSDEEKLNNVRTSLLEYRISKTKNSNIQDAFLLLKRKSTPDDANMLMEKALKAHDDYELLLLQIKECYLGRDNRMTKLTKIADLLM